LRVACNRNNTLWRSRFGIGIDRAAAKRNNSERVAHFTRFITNRQHIV
jgi:hypothetical protein